MGYNANDRPCCDMVEDCTNPVTHIGQKGYLYCESHVERRRGTERCRRLRQWEVEKIERHEVIESYAPISRAESDRRTAARNAQIEEMRKLREDHRYKQ